MSLRPTSMARPLSRKGMSSQRALVDDSSKGSSEDHRQWQPMILQRKVLALFVMMYTAMIAALAMLYGFSERSQGLGATRTDYYYLWTYGPTAVLTVVAALWGQVEYRAKQLQPWMNMARGPASGENSVLLDYVSPWNVTALFTSLRMRHHMVTLAIFGSLLIKVLIIFSTSLFALRETTSQNRNVQLLATDRFDTTEMNLTKWGKVVDDRPYMTTIGKNLFNSRLPPGTTDQYAFQSFDVVDDAVSLNATLDGTVDVFHADLICERANATMPFPDRSLPVNSTFRSNLTLITPSCVMRDLNMVSRRYAPWMTQQAFLRYLSILTCENEQGEQPPHDDWTGSNDRLVVAVARPVDWVPAWEINSLICRPEFRLSSGIVTTTRTPPDSQFGPNVSVALDTSTFKPLNETDDKMLAQVDRAIYNAWAAQGPETEATFIIVESGMMDATPADYMSADFLEQQVRKTFSSVAAQVAKINFMKPANESFVGTATTKEFHLWAQGLTFIFMEVILVLLIVITATIMILYSPHATCSRDPGPIGGLATILARNTKSTALFSGLGPFRTSFIRQCISGYRFRVVAGSEGKGLPLQILPIGPKVEVVSDGTTNSHAHQIRWWQPLYVKLFPRFVVVIVPLVLIIVLEVLYQTSLRFNAIAEVTLDGYYHYAWTLVPTLIMLCVRSLFDNVDFSVRLLQPYTELSRKKATARLSIMNNPIGKIALHALWNALTKKEWAAAASTSAMLLAPLLAVTVSGLYEVQRATYSRQINIQLSDSLSPLANSYATRCEFPRCAEHVVAGMALNNNISYPPWTYEEFAFPTLNVASAEDVLSPDDSGVGLRLEASVPALRAAFNCSTLPTSWVTIEKVPISVMINVNLTVGEPLTSECGFSMSEEVEWINETSATFAEWWSLVDPVDRNTVWPERYRNTSHARPHLPDVAAGCPWLLTLFGQVRGQDGREGLTLLGCAPYLEEVQVNATFLLPGYEVDATRPPRADESTARVIPGSGLELARGFLPPLVSTSFPDLTNNEGFGEIVSDRIYQTMIYGRNGVPEAELLGAANVPRLKDRLEHVLAVWVAQMINANSRVDALASRPPVLGTLINPSRPRLVQSAISTRILQGLLGAMVVCIGTAFILLRTRRVLPKNPCSIAAVASLLSGADMLTEKYIPTGAEWCDDKELRKRGVFEGHTFSMGWWRDAKTGKERFGIDVDGEGRGCGGAVGVEKSSVGQVWTSLQSYLGGLL